MPLLMITMITLVHLSIGGLTAWFQIPHIRCCDVPVLLAPPSIQQCNAWRPSERQLWNRETLIHTAFTLAHAITRHHLDMAWGVATYVLGSTCLIYEYMSMHSTLRSYKVLDTWVDVDHNAVCYMKKWTNETAFSSWEVSINETAPTVSLKQN